MSLIHDAHQWLGRGLFPYCNTFFLKRKLPLAVPRPPGTPPLLSTLQMSPPTPLPAIPLAVGCVLQFIECLALLLTNAIIPPRDHFRHNNSVHRWVGVCLGLPAWYCHLGFMLSCVCQETVPDAIHGGRLLPRDASQALT